MVSEENEQIASENKEIIEKDEVVQSGTGEKVIDETSSTTQAEVAEEKLEEEIEMVEIPKKRLEELENAEAAALEEIKRERASVINYRKRLEKQRDEFAEIASARVLTKLLDLEDDVKRIMDNGKENIPKEHLEGIQMLAQRIKTIFEQEGVKILNIIEGKTRFDPRYHEPILAQPNAELPDKTITTVVNAGFVKGERVLRPAKVIITQKPPEKKEDKNEISSSNKVEKSSTINDESKNDQNETHNQTKPQENEVQQ